MEEDFKPKRYVCKQWPELRLGAHVKFERGFFTAQSQQAVDAIENNKAFGVQIHPVKWEPKPIPAERGPIEEMIESDIAAELAKTQPRVRRGALGTR